MFLTLKIKIINGSWYSKKYKLFKGFKNIDEIQKFKEKMSKRNNNPTTIFKQDNINYLYARLDGTNFNGVLLFLMYFKVLKLKVNFTEIYKQDKGSQKTLSFIKKYFNDVILKINDSKVIKNNLIIGNKKDSIRNQPIFTANLLRKYGFKHCFWCYCEISELIDSSHLYSIKKIDENTNLTSKIKLNYAISNDNGIFLCKNHHKSLDRNLIKIKKDGKIKFNNLEIDKQDWLSKITTRNLLKNSKYWNDKMYWFYKQENLKVNL